MAQKHNPETEKTPGGSGAMDTWDFGLKLVGTIATAAGIIIGVWQYNSKNAEEKHMEFKRNMYGRKLAAYEKVGESVADLLTVRQHDLQYISPVDTIAFDSCEKIFKQLYWGVLPLVEDTNVEKMMIRFSDEVHYYRRGEDPYDSLVSRGVALMDTCKRSLERYWARKSQYEEMASSD